ncbi:MAG TPA: DUF1028 domain-containing protein [Candidatus Aminicenantes bacterium]|nr:DUF1028 domain-containing protein [Candidatus Aminicenantes bacterium]
MKKSTVAFVLMGLCLVPHAAAEQAEPLVSTYSIVARDADTGEIGVAVQSHWFSVGSIVCWAEAGVGAVATQSFVDPSYGPLGLRLMRSGKSPQQALSGLLKADSHPEVRQVAMINACGDVAVHTGNSCIAAAGHQTGDGYSCQANMMEKDTVPAAMAAAYETTKGSLVDRLMAALEAAQAEKGDIRGKQSAAIIVVAGESFGVPWKGRLFDLRVEDHSRPLKELKRLIRIAKAYRHMNRGDEYLAEKKVDLALEAYSRAMEIYPDNPELMFWPATLLAASGRVEESLPLFRKVFARNPNWGELLKRLPAAGQFPDDPALLKRILELLQD